MLIKTAKIPICCENVKERNFRLSHKNLLRFNARALLQNIDDLHIMMDARSGIKAMVR